MFVNKSLALERLMNKFNPYFACLQIDCLNKIVASKHCWILKKYKQPLAMPKCSRVS